MDLQTGLVYVGVVVVSAAVILLVSMFGIKEKSYEEAIAEQRKLPDDLLLNKKDKGKEKKHRNKAGKKVKEKKEEKDEKDEKDEKEEREEKPEHVQFEETPHILPPEPVVSQENSKGGKKKGKLEKVKPILINKDEPSVIVTDLSPSQSPLTEANHFDLIHPKDDLELIRSHSRENLEQLSQNEPVVSKSPKDTPTKPKKGAKEAAKKKDDVKDISASASSNVKEKSKEVKEQLKEAPVKEIKEAVKESVPLTQSANKESKKNKKKNDILAQIGGEKGAVNVSLLMLLLQKAELSRSEIQVLIDQLLNKQQDNPLEHSEWTEGRTDPVIKLKKQLAEKEKALADEHEANVAFQNKLKELRAEFNSERSRLSGAVKQLEETLNAKVTEAQTLHTRMQHILESHAAEKQGFARQIEQLQTKINEDAAIIHKMQEDQGQTQGHMQQELIAQRKQMEVQFGQMRENENALKTQLAQKHIEVQELQNELQATCDSSSAEIDMLRQQLGIMQTQFMHSEGQLQHFKEAGDRLQDVVRQLEESHRAHADLDHRLKNAHRHEQELQKQVNALQMELNVAKAEANEASSYKAELNKAQSELSKLKSELSQSKNEAVEITTLKAALNGKEEDLKKSQNELSVVRNDLMKFTAETKQWESKLRTTRDELDAIKKEFEKAGNNLTKAQDEANNYRSESLKLKEELSQALDRINSSHESVSELKMLKSEMSRLQVNEKNLSDLQLQLTRLQEENERLSSQLVNIADMQKELKQLREENESLASQLAATTERPAAEGRENGIEQKEIETMEHASLIAQKEKQLDALKVELSHKEAEISQLNVQVENLKSKANDQHSIAKRLQEDLDAQRSKNNELRVKNWKVMEALSAAESRAKSNSGSSTHEVAQSIKTEQENLTKALLQRIFPEIKVSEKSHEQWISAFEKKICSVLADLKNKNTASSNNELEKQNKQLQGMISHYKQIIDDTENMLNKLQSHIESEETRWQAQLRQKENDVTNLRVEINELRGKLKTEETLQKKVTELESRLASAESHAERADVKLPPFKGSGKSRSDGDTSHNVAQIEKLEEEKARLSEKLQDETSRSVNLNAEVGKLRSVVEATESSLVKEKALTTQLQQELARLKSDTIGGCSSAEQSILNGPPTANSPQAESTKKSTAKRRGFAGWFRKKITSRNKLR